MDNIIVALDFETKEKTLEFLDSFKDKKLYVKVGMELFYKAGAEILTEISKRQHKIFLDLKLHDIPNTVERAMRAISSYNVFMTTIHAAGGIEMMKAAKRGLGNDTLLLAVTQLTSTTEESMHYEQNIMTPLNESVLNYVKIAQEAKCDAIVCSPLEVSMLKEKYNKLKYVTPGIRLNTNQNDDQKRKATPKMAKSFGSDYIVVGRPITRAKNPLQAYENILESWRG